MMYKEIVSTELSSDLSISVKIHAECEPPFRTYWKIDQNLLAFCISPKRKLFNFSTVFTIPTFKIILEDKQFITATTSKMFSDQVNIPQMKF